MTMEDIQAELSLLLSEMEGDYGDRHEVHERVRQLIDKSRAFGLEPPADLLALSEALEAIPVDDPDAAKAGLSGIARTMARKKEDLAHRHTAEKLFRGH